MLHIYNFSSITIELFVI